MSTDQSASPELSGADAAGGAGVPVIRFEDVEKRFGDNVVLSDLNFDVAHGERVTLIGPSGSGKTTILRLVMTLETLSDGYIWIDGKPLTHDRRNGQRFELREKEIAETRKKIGMVFQHFNLFPNMSVIDNLTEAPVHVLGRSKKEATERGMALLDQVGLADRSHAHPSHLSGGQKQRVAIARALAMDPEILLLDEVTSALDPELVGDVLGVLRDVADNTDISMLIVTHEMAFARDVSHKVMMFDGGQVIEQGSPADLLGNPQRTRTQRFLETIL